MRAVLLSLAIASMAGNSSLADNRNGHANFPGIGEVFIQTSRPNNELPRLIFRNAQGRLLPKGSIGFSNPSIFRMNPLENSEGRKNPVLHYSVIRDLGLKPIVFAISMYGGGSDCEYEAAAFGEHNRRLQPLFIKQPLVNAEGGMFFGDLGLGRGVGFASWNFIWVLGSEGHADPHRYRLDLYRLNAHTGKFVKIAEKVTRAAYASDEEVLAELGVAYPNLLRSFPDLGC